MRNFILRDDMLFEKYERGGGQVSDQTRIEWMQKKITLASLVAMTEHRKMVKSLGKQDPAQDTDWFKYSDVLIMVCSDLAGTAAVDAPAQAPACTGTSTGTG